MVRVRTSSFSSLKPTDLVAAAQASYDAVNAGSGPAGTYLGITPPPLTVQPAIADLAAKIAAAKKGSTQEKNDRDMAVTVLLSYLFQWAGWLTTKCPTLNTDEERIAFIEGAEFVPTSQGGNIGPLSAVSNLRSKSQSHQIAIEWDAKRGAHSYKVMKTEGYATEESVWTELTITTRAKAICVAPVGEVMSFAVYPIGTAGIGAVSEYVTGMANL